MLQKIEIIRERVKAAARAAAKELHAFVGKTRAEDIVVGDVIGIFPDVAAIHEPDLDEDAPYIDDLEKILYQSTSQACN